MEQQPVEQAQITQLNQHMFNILNELNNPDADLDKTLKKARASVEVGTVIVNSVKTGLDYVRLKELARKNDLAEEQHKTKQLGNGK